MTHTRVGDPVSDLSCKPQSANLDHDTTPAVRYSAAAEFQRHSLLSSFTCLFANGQRKKIKTQEDVDIPHTYAVKLLSLSPLPNADDKQLPPRGRIISDGAVNYVSGRRCDAT